MRELSLNILDIVENSVKAEAKIVYIDVIAKDMTAVGMASAGPTIAPRAFASAQLNMLMRFTAVAFVALHESSAEKRSRFTPKLSSVTVAAKRAASGRGARAT